MLDVLEDEQRGVVGLHVRLRRAVHVHRHAAALVPLERDVLCAHRSRLRQVEDEHALLAVAGEAEATQDREDVSTTPWVRPRVAPAAAVEPGASRGAEDGAVGPGPRHALCVPPPHSRHTVPTSVQPPLPGGTAVDVRDDHRPPRVVAEAALDLGQPMVDLLLVGSSPPKALVADDDARRAPSPPSSDPARPATSSGDGEVGHPVGERQARARPSGPRRPRRAHQLGLEARRSGELRQAPPQPLAAPARGRRRRSRRRARRRRGRSRRPGPRSV